MLVFVATIVQVGHQKSQEETIDAPAELPPMSDSQESREPVKLPDGDGKNHLTSGISRPHINVGSSLGGSSSGHVNFRDIIVNDLPGSRSNSKRFILACVITVGLLLIIGCAASPFFYSKFFASLGDSFAPSPFGHAGDNSADGISNDSPRKAAKPSNRIIRIVPWLNVAPLAMLNFEPSQATVSRNDAVTIRNSSNAPCDLVAQIGHFNGGIGPATIQPGAFYKLPLDRSAQLTLTCGSQSISSLTLTTL